MVAFNTSRLTVTLYSLVRTAPFITTQNIQSLSWRYNRVRLYGAGEKGHVHGSVTVLCGFQCRHRLKILRLEGGVAEFEGNSKWRGRTCEERGMLQSRDG